MGLLFGCRMHFSLTPAYQVLLTFRSGHASDECNPFWVRFGSVARSFLFLLDYRLQSW